MIRSMMSPTDLPFTFWGYALETAAFTLNRVPSKAVEKTPYEMWTGKRPSLSFLKIWGCEAYIKRQFQISWSPSLINVFLWGILKRLRDTTFTIQ